MKLDMRKVKNTGGAVLVLVLSACSDSSRKITLPESTVESVSKAFSVEVKSVSVERLSTGEVVEVDASMAKSESLTYEPGVD
ncbi:hypothetical protein ACJJIX_03625 [Microbulbifer sp. VAAC004]|uniref:hypothetical protein n=1 Tax=unclassified Microbulbifer TaxID=2619833 RepID=UPI0040393B6F